LFENLASFCRQDYEAPIHMVFGVDDPSDPAIGVVRQIQQLDGARKTDLLVGGKLHGLNRKVSSLIDMAQLIRHDVIIVADSDIRVGPDYLSRVIAALEQPGTAAVTCLYYGIGVAGFWAELAALAINAHFLPGVIVGLALGRAHPCFGSTIALKRES